MQKKKGVRIAKTTLIKEEQASQINEFKAFLYMRRHKGLGSLKSFL